MKTRDYARIVVDGMDGSGKSTLVQSLITYLGNQAHYVPGYNRVEGEKPPMPQWWMDQLAYNPYGKIVVHDRFFYPELVYGPILRGKIEGDGATLSYVREYLRSRSLLIYCRPPVEVISKGLEVQEQMVGVRAFFQQLLTAYDQLMLEEARVMDGRFISYDWTESEALVKLIKRMVGYIYV